MPPVEEVEEVVETEVPIVAASEEGSEHVPPTKDQEAEEAAFLAAFQDSDGTAKVVPETPAVVVETPVVAEAPVVVPPVVSEPALAKITDAQWNDVLNRSNGDELRASIEKIRGDAFGKIGGLERTIRQIQEATPVGKPVVVKADDLAEFKVEFPDLAEKLAKDLTKVLSQFTGTGEATATLPADFEERVVATVDVRVKDAREKMKIEDSLEVLSDAYEDWRTITGPKDSQTDYRKWLGAQPASYQTKVLGSNNGLVIARSIDAFKTYEKESAIKSKGPVLTAAHIRAERLKEAVPAKGGAATPPGPKIETEEEAFYKAFNS